METVASPVSILATRDWLERTNFATGICESPRCVRSARRASGEPELDLDQRGLLPGQAEELVHGADMPSRCLEPRLLACRVGASSSIGAHGAASHPWFVGHIHGVSHAARWPRRPGEEIVIFHERRPAA
jgi:hypothetical protein